MMSVRETTSAGSSVIRPAGWRWALQSLMLRTHQTSSNVRHHQADKTYGAALPPRCSCRIPGSSLTRQVRSRKRTSSANTLPLCKASGSFGNSFGPSWLQARRIP